MTASVSPLVIVEVVEDALAWPPRIALVGKLWLHLGALYFIFIL